jgi:hypothetical protein
MQLYDLVCPEDPRRRQFLVDKIRPWADNHPYRIPPYVNSFGTAKFGLASGNIARRTASSRWDDTAKPPT